MKKFIFLSVMMLFLVSFSHAQKGKVVLGADYHLSQNYYVYYDYGYYPYPYSLGASLEPNVGYFITDNLVLGLGFKSSTNNIVSDANSVDPWGSGVEMTQESTSTSQLMSLAPYVKFYHNNLFVRASASFQSSTYTSENYYGQWDYDTDTGMGTFLGFDESTSESAAINTKFAINLGYSLMYNDKLCFEPSFGLAKSVGGMSSEYTNDPINGDPVTTSTNSPSTDGLDFAIMLGVHLRLGK